MAETRVFRFEEVGEDLHRPPLAAIRLFTSVGFVVRFRAWREVPLDARWAMVAAGSRDDIDQQVARVLTNELSPGDVQLTPAREPSPLQPNPEVAQMLGGGERAAGEWARFRPFERFVLNALSANSRLLWRALTEIRGRTPGKSFHGTVARAEVRLKVEGELRRDLLRLLAQDLLLQGRGLVLARATGRRAARIAGELFDLHAETTTGIVELDWLVQTSTRTVLWQGHASTADGVFFPAASLAAVTLAAASLCDMLKEFDAHVEVRRARLGEEQWVVGAQDTDESTVLL